MHIIMIIGLVVAVVARALLLNESKYPQFSYCNSNMKTTKKLFRRTARCQIHGEFLVSQRRGRIRPAQKHL